MRRLLVVAGLLAGLSAFAACGTVKSEPVTPPFYGRWVSVSILNQTSRSVSVRLEPTGKFFGTDINTNTGMQYTMTGKWVKIDPLTLQLTTDDGKETYTVKLDEKEPTSILSGEGVVATLTRAPD